MMQKQAKAPPEPGPVAGPGTITDSVGLLVAGARRRLKQLAWRRFAEFGVTPPQVGVLLILHGAAGSLTLRQVAERLHADDPTACRVVRKLVERRLVRATGHAADRRCSSLELTARGRELAGRLEGVAAELQRGIEDGLAPATLESLKAGLRAMIANLDRLDAAAGRRPRARAR